MAPTSKETLKEGLLRDQPSEFVRRQKEKQRIRKRTRRRGGEAVFHQAPFAKGITGVKLGDNRSGGVRHFDPAVHYEEETGYGLSAAIYYFGFAVGVAGEAPCNAIEFRLRQAIVRMHGFQEFRDVRWRRNHGNPD